MSRDGHTERRAPIPRYASVAVLAAVVTIGMKGVGYLLTDSVAILSDALESLVNLATAITSLFVVSIATRPADEEHAYGHTKAEYFASGFEGAMILVAALSIAWAAGGRLLNPVPIGSIALGGAFLVGAALVNLAAARFLFRASQQFRSIALEASGHHLMVDVWTSVGVVGGLLVVNLTGWFWLDPVIALVVAAHILRAGYGLIRRSLMGLLDTALPEDLRLEIGRILDAHRSGGVQYHAIRTRQAGSWRFISFHILVPGDWSVQRGHDLLEEIEEEIRAAIPDSTVFTHLEPIEDPLSWEDTGLRRPQG